MTEWIGETFRSDVGWDHLETLVDIRNRMAGSEGERRGAEATRDALDSYARDAHLEEFPIQGWERGSSSVRTPAGEETAIALPRSPGGEVSGRLVDLDYGLPEDFENADLEGAVVMVRTDVPEWYDRFIHRREKYYYAVEAGAAGFVFANHYDGCLPPTGSVGNEDRPIGDVPAVGVSKEVSARLSRRFEGDEVELAVSVETGEATSYNVHADLGPDTEEEVLVTAHHDAHDVAEGAMDNGAGTAMIIELARILAEREDELDVRVRFVVFGSEEVGLVGSSYDAEHRDTDAVKAVLNFDGVVRNRTLKFLTHDFDGLERAAKTVAEDFDHPIVVSPEQGPHSDHWPYVVAGVPGYHVTTDAEDAGRGWGHTQADTLDKMEKRTFREQAILLAELAVHLASKDVSVAHASPADIAAALEDEDKAEGMKVIGDWPF